MTATCEAALGSAAAAASSDYSAWTGLMSTPRDVHPSRRRCNVPSVSHAAYLTEQNAGRAGCVAALSLLRPADAITKRIIVQQLALLAQT